MRTYMMIAGVLLTALLLGGSATAGLAQGGQHITGYYTSAGDNLSPDQAVLTDRFAPDDDLNLLVLFDGQHEAAFEITYTVTDPTGEQFVSDLEIPVESRWAVLGFDWERRDDGSPWPTGRYTGVLSTADGTAYEMSFLVDDRLQDVDSIIALADDKTASYYNIWRLEHVVFGERGEYEFVAQVPFNWMLADLLDPEWVDAAQTLESDSDYDANYIASAAQSWNDLAVLTNSVLPQMDDDRLAFRPQPWWLDTNLSNHEDLDTLPFMSLNNYIEGDFPCSLIEQVTNEDSAAGVNVRFLTWGDGPYDCAQREDNVVTISGEELHATYLFLPDPRGNAIYQWYIGVHEASYPQVEGDIDRVFHSLRAISMTDAPLITGEEAPTATPDAGSGDSK